MFRLFIRDVFWLTVVVGLAVGWWLDRRESLTSVERLETEKREVERQLGIATYDPAKF